MFKHFLLMVAVLGLVLMSGCVTARPAVIVPAGIDQPVYVPAGERVIVVSPYDPTLRVQSQADVYRHIENMANINQHAQSDQLRYQADRARQQQYAEQRARQDQQRAQENLRRDAIRTGQQFGRQVQSLRRDVGNRVERYYRSQQ